MKLQQVIAHDLSGYKEDENFEKNGGTDKEKWNIFNLFWADRIGTKDVLLAHVTKHKRFERSVTNYVGSSIEDRLNYKSENIELALHVYVDGKLHEFSYEDIGFMPMLYNDSAIINENLYNRLWPETHTPILNKKYGSVTSDSTALFAFAVFMKPKDDEREVKKEDLEETCLVKLEIQGENPVFSILRKDPASEGYNNVVNCYQREIKEKEKVITPFAAFYRVGDQGVKGKTYFTKDSATTWELINSDEYNFGGGLYFMGNQFYKVEYGHAFET